MRTPDAVPAGKAASAGRVVVEGRVEAPAGRGGACAGWASSFEWAFGPHGHTVVQTDRCSASAWDGVSITDGTAKLALDPRLAEQAGHAMPSGPRPGATVEKGDCASGASVEIAGCREKDTLVPCDGSGAWLPGGRPETPIRVACGRHDRGSLDGSSRADGRRVPHRRWTAERHVTDSASSGTVPASSESQGRRDRPERRRPRCFDPRVQVGALRSPVRGDSPRRRAAPRGFLAESPGRRLPPGPTACKCPCRRPESPRPSRCCARGEIRSNAGTILGESPSGWTWHHVPDQPGVMQLVPRAMHQGSTWQPLHPGGVGGFKLWGADS
jgi:hypothetical protein